MLACLALALLALLCGEVRAAAGPKVAVKKKPPPRARPCLDLPEEILEQMFGRLSVGVLGAFDHTLQLAAAADGGGNLTCPSGARGSIVGGKSRPPVNALSISPWTYRITHDPARFPRYIPEAHCLCRGCLLGPRGEESSRYRSTPVYMPTVVLRRTGTCAGGRHTYAEQYVSIAVGCTCVPPMDKPPVKTGNQTREREEERRAVARIKLQKHAARQNHTPPGQVARQTDRF